MKFCPKSAVAIVSFYFSVASVSSLAAGASDTPVPKGAVGHYLLANTLAKSGQHPLAIREYQSALSLAGSDPQIAYMCRLALKGYNTLPESKDNQHSATSRRLAEQAKDAISQIDRETLTTQNDHQELANQATLKAQDAARNVSRIYYGHGRHTDSKRDRASEESIISNGRNTSAGIMKESRAHVQAAEDRIRSLTQAADNLEEQMHAPSRSGSNVQPVHQGTNLYVRNYVNFGESSEPEPAVIEPFKAKALNYKSRNKQAK